MKTCVDSSISGFTITDLRCNSTFNRPKGQLQRFSVKAGNTAALQIFPVNMDKKETGSNEVCYGKRRTYDKI